MALYYKNSRFFVRGSRKSGAAFAYSRTEKSARAKAIFLPLDPTIGYREFLKCESFIHWADRVFRQEYIFAHFVHHVDLACLKKHTESISTARLILFESLNSLPFIPCLTCEPKTYSKIQSVSIHNIRQLWDAENKDMHKYLIFILDTVNATCGLLHSGFNNVRCPCLCPIATIAEKYNLTLTQYMGHYITPTSFVKNSFGVFFYRIGEVSPDEAMYEINVHIINFMTVTNPPSPGSGVATFVSPFDTGTWTSLLFSVISVAGCLTWLAWKGGESKDAVTFLTIMTEKVIMVACILLGQVGESTGKAYQSRKIVWILLILWLLGNFLLMANLYQGSIYSCLAIPKPIQTPHGVEALVNWNLPVIVMDDLYNAGTGRQDSYLLDYIIPRLMSKESHRSPKFLKLLSKFLAIVLPRNNNTFSLWDKTIRANSSTSRTIVVMKPNVGLETDMILNKYLGNRQIVLNKGDSPFNVVEFKVGSANLLTPYTVRELERMMESGLSNMWEKVLRINCILRTLNPANEKKYFEALQNLFGKVKQAIAFHEATPVSVELIEPIFAVCGVLVISAMAGFVLENRNLLQTFMQCIYAICFCN